MLQLDPGALIKTLNTYCTKALEGAAGVCVARGHYEVTVEHLLHLMLDESQSDIHIILRHFDVDPGRLQKAILKVLEREKNGNTGRPVFSPLLLAWMQDSWLLTSAEFKQQATRSATLFLTLRLSAHRYTSADYVELIGDIPVDELRKHALQLVKGSIEDGAPRSELGTEPLPSAAAHGKDPDSALGRFTIDFTAQARAAELDPVIGRDVEIRQCIDVLARRRKNNPIIVGEAGVGKTALVEGLAQRIVDGRVPTVLQDIDLLGLDLGLLQAGAGMKGEFENRLKSVIKEVQDADRPIILFIDEAHTMIGAGGPTGGSDAANLLKPALARGELRTVAATTWSEYKKYFEKDPALTRRFQLVKVDEPDSRRAIDMMRGIAPHYEQSHGIRIRDEALVAAVQLSDRYIAGRQLPDKAVDLLDTCAARVAIARDARPKILEQLDVRVEELSRELTALQREEADGYASSDDRLVEVRGEIDRLGRERIELESRWQLEREALIEVLNLRDHLSQEDVSDDTSNSTTGSGEENHSNAIASQRSCGNNGRARRSPRTTRGVAGG